MTYAPKGDEQDVDKLKTWMTEMPDVLKQTPIIYLAIPGSHDTFSYNITRWADVSPDSPPIVKFISALAKPISHPFIYNWSKTQRFDIEEQLKFGIRYLDIRISHKDHELYVVHGLYGGKFINCLEKINVFLNQSPGEVVIMDFQHLYHFTVETHSRLIGMLEHVLGIKIFKRKCDIKTVCLKDVVDEGGQAIIIYRDDFANDSPFVWPSSCWPTYWPNKVEVCELIQILDKEVESRVAERGFVSQFILTVDTFYVLRHLLSSLKSIALAANEYLKPWIHSKCIGPSGVNVVICDFIDADFSKAVINLNYERLKKNKSLVDV